MIDALKCRKLDYLKIWKNVRIEHMKNDKGGHINLSIHFEADFLL